MKKRIVAILLSLSVFCCSLSCGKRSSAAPAVGAIMAIGVLAWEIIGVCTGMYDETAAAIGELIESGVDGFINPDSPFQQNWSAGWDTICSTVEGWFNNGELEIENGQIKLTYDQFHELYGQMINVTSKPDIEFQTDYNYLFLDVDLSKTFAGSDLPLINGIYNQSSGYGQSYIPVYFNDNTIVFSDTSFYFMNKSATYSVGMQSTASDFKDTHSSVGGLLGSWGPYTDKPYEFLKDWQFYFYFPSLTDFSMSRMPYLGNPIPEIQTYRFTSSNCFVYSDGNLTYKPVSEVDISGMNSGLVTTTGAYGDFLKSINGYTASVVAPDNLTDLSDVLPTEYNPTLSFPVDPDLSRPIANQVIVGDVPGVSDLPLSDYQAKLDTDIDVPSIIVTKFPFCIPYDFMRFLGLLCADPVAPVFRIPISTNPDNLEQWIGNQTVGEYLNTDEPLFEIDEEIVIDLSVIPLVQPVCYTCFIVGFIFLLLHITPKMIQH